jgi:hypothetical protein
VFLPLLFLIPPTCTDLAVLVGRFNELKNLLRDVLNDVLGDALRSEALGGDALGGDALGGDALGGDVLGDDLGDNLGDFLGEGNLCRGALCDEIALAALSKLLFRVFRFSINSLIQPLYVLASDSSIL